MPSGKKKYIFEKGECELIIARIKPINNSILITQKCVECGNPTGLCYFSDSPKPERMKQKCQDCLQEELNQAFKKDQSHIKRMSEN